MLTWKLTLIHNDHCLITPIVIGSQIPCFQLVYRSDWSVVFQASKRSTCIQIKMKHSYLSRLVDCLFIIWYPKCSRGIDVIFFRQTGENLARSLPLFLCFSTSGPIQAEQVTGDLELSCGNFSVSPSSHSL